MQGNAAYFTVGSLKFLYDSSSLFSTTVPFFFFKKILPQLWFVFLNIHLLCCSVGILTFVLSLMVVF